MWQAKCVLVADPCADTAESLAWLLRWWGHDVRLARTGPAALEMARAYRPDAILMELALPGLNGYEVARQLRRQRAFASTLLVALTGFGSEQHCRLSREAGFDHHLVKPAEPDVWHALLLTARSPTPLAETGPPEDAAEVNAPRLVLSASG